MKRPRSSSYGEDFDDGNDVGEKLGFKDWPRRNQDPDRSVSSSHRRPSYSKTEGLRKVSSSSSSHDRPLDDDWEPSRHIRRRYDHEPEPFDWRKSYDRYRDGRDGGDRLMQASSPRGSYGSDRMHRSESFSGLRREFPKGFRSDRDRSRREGNASSSWWRSRSSKELSTDEVRKSPSVDSDSVGRRSHAASPDDHRGKVRSRDSPSGVQSRRVEIQTVKTSKPCKESGSSSEMEEGELEPDPKPEPEPEPVAEPSSDSKAATGLESEKHKDRDPEYNSLSEEVPDQKEILVGGKKVDVDDNGSVVVQEEGKITNTTIMDTKNTDDQSTAVKELDEDSGEGEGMARDANGDNEVEGKFCGEKCDAVKELDESRREGERKAQDANGDIEVEVKFCATKQEACGEDNSCSQFHGEEPAGNHEELAVEEEAKEMTFAISPLKEEKLVEDKEEAQPNEAVVEIEQAVEEEVKVMTASICPLQKEISTENKKETQCNEAKVEAKQKHETANEQGVETEDEIQQKHETGMEFEVQEKEQSGIDLETEPEGTSILFDQTREVTCEINHEVVTLTLMRDQSKMNYKDKGKGLAISLSAERDSVEDDDAIEGPSGRGFELVFRSDTSQPEKACSSGIVARRLEDDNLKIEPLDLCLALPGGLFDHSSKHSKPKIEIPSCARDIQESLPSSFRTNSNGFTTSISFTSSQPFVHNPSCSLTQNSLDNYEYSVGSHPIFQGVDQVSSGTIWQAQTSNDSKMKGSVPLYQRVLLNGNLSHNLLNTANGQHQSVPTCIQQSSLPGQMSPTDSHGSHETGSQLNKDKRLLMGERNSSSLCRTEKRDGEQLVLNGSGVTEKILSKIMAEPLHLSGRMLQEMTDPSVAYLRETISEMLIVTDKSRQMREFQEALRRRSDMTMDTLINCPRVLLEILVAIRMGLPDFIRRTTNLKSSDLVEIFLNLKCRNIACRNSLPVDDCDCKVCIDKTGFCSACMCLVCSKFDNASNTCSWVGCDVCLHWCHTDCGLQGSHIRNGISTPGDEEIPEMQFHCVACHHPSEMFGFVKEVFKTCAKDWKVDTLAKELQYVKRIFSASNDLRGKRLHDLSDKMLLNLEKKANHSEVVMHILTFLSDSEFNLSSASISTPKGSSRNEAGRINVACSSKDWLPSVPSEKASLLENTGLVLSMGCDQVGRKARDVELQMNLEKKPVVDELESVIKFKHAEAKMYQERADDARREAESLKHISIAKNSKIDEDYASQIEKLRLSEAEERRRQKFEELQAIEKAHREYFNMKMRMEADIKDLLLKMEATRRNLNT
ncbi:hypothetical protein MUK42_35216 [Musa troglodytarum]|uniref:Protein OBERON 4 n=1 Tax=Musa troglodytarum TaxID=320322 RepID=A0A9E7FBS4_9LILI|nr:hypothetical protein MUK42_35216 [Musa troglodytarum]